MNPCCNPKSNPAPSFISLRKKLSSKILSDLCNLTRMKDAFSSIIFQWAVTLQPGVKLFWVTIVKTHYKTPLLSSPCNYESQNYAEILSSYWNQPSSVQVRLAVVRSHIYVLPESCLKREGLIILCTLGLRLL